jgi:hypothetical protein
MRAPRVLALALVLAGLAVPAANGETVRVDDPAGDGLKGRAAYGDLGVWLRVRGHSRRDGDYGAVRIKAITEIGSDADLAPDGTEGHWPWFPWVSRG